MANERDDHSPSFVRPFLAGGRSFDLDEDEEADVGVRPYFVTGGRTRSSNEEMAYETIAVADGVPRVRLDLERAQIVRLCQTPQSMAELSAKLNLPIGAVLVLAGDLADAGVLRAHSAPTGANDDIGLIDTLIAAIRKL